MVGRVFPGMKNNTSQRYGSVVETVVTMGELSGRPSYEHEFDTVFYGEEIVCVSADDTFCGCR